MGDEETAAVESFLAPHGASAAVGRRWRTTSTTAKDAPSGCLFMPFIITLLNAIFSNNNSIFLIDTPFFE